MKKLYLLLLFAIPIIAKDKDAEPARRLQESATVLSEVMSADDKSIPEDLLGKAHCIVIVPGMKKGAFIVGAKYGKGFVSCRTASNAAWSAPAAIRVEGGSFGFQIGGSETDVIMLVMTERGAEKLLQSKFTVGGDAEVAAGPVGRSASAQTDAKMTAEILSWSRSRGVFAGIALQGATLRPDLDDNELLYGKRMDSHDIVMSKTPAPPSAAKLLEMLKRYSPHEKS